MELETFTRGRPVVINAYLPNTVFATLRGVLAGADGHGVTICTALDETHGVYQRIAWFRITSMSVARDND